VASVATIASRRVRTNARTWDAAFVGLSLAHAAVLLTAPSIPVIALGLWWSSNTIAHNFIHRPFFRSRAANRGYSAFLSLVLGVPQAIWRARHLAHHAGGSRRTRVDRDVIVETTLVVALWTTLVAIAPLAFMLVYLPGWILGLALCQLHGHYEHARGTTSHYGRLYNLLFFNDGYHVEHHARPARHWTELADERRADGRSSRWPPILRWLEPISLQTLERLVLRSPALQRFVLSVHARAFQRLRPALGEVRRVLVVGGGLFPRTALVVRRVMPSAAITIVDVEAAHLAVARPFVDHDVSLVCARFEPGVPADADVVILPLAFIGDRDRAYAEPSSRAVLVHDWIWARRGRGVVVSWWLLKRLNLVERRA
jgi:hypothetical protein